ncbi:hypothetical protein KJ765_04150 [Candidatus Micrarchaeota archaeon]|nr:hypothetical protein [Candidatus Micrarchaeota archaeon]
MKMQLDVLKEDGFKLQLHVKKTRVGLMNALRRTMLSELESYAIDRVDFYENNSAMFNEYLANRIGLVPLTWEESVADDAEVTFSMNAEGPCMVYSRDMRSNDEKIRVFNENIPIIKLAADQRLRFEGFAIKGKGKQHAKFQSVLASYSLVPLKRSVKELAEVDKSDSKGIPEEFREDEYIFFVESYNNVRAADHLKRALTLLQAKLDALEAVKELK